LAGTTSASASPPTGNATFTNLFYNLLNPYLAESVVVDFTSPGLATTTNSLVTVGFGLNSITLSNNNSVVLIDPTAEAGMYSWTVDGTSQLYQDWFWLRQGSSGPQSSIDQLGTPLGLSYTATNANLVYLSPGLSINLGFTLNGGASGSMASLVVESLVIQNTTNLPASLHVFGYADFDLAGSAEGDTVSFPTTNSVLQEGKEMQVTESVQGPAPNYWEASWYAVTLDQIESGSPPTLLDELIPPKPGDQTFAYQWDVTLGAGQTFAVNLVNSIQREAAPLDIAVQGGNVILSWPTNTVAGAQLQTSSALGAAANWAAVTNLPVIFDENYQVSVAPTGSTRFYRLKE
jgi:hypothetical protein